MRQKFKSARLVFDRPHACWRCDVVALRTRQGAQRMDGCYFWWGCLAIAALLGMPYNVNFVDLGGEVLDADRASELSDGTA